jgi:Tol biopolymer transport system component
MLSPTDNKMNSCEKEDMTPPLRASRLHLQIALLLLAAIRLTCEAGSLQLVSGMDSGQTPPAGGGGDSFAPILSSNGRFVLFASTANNLSTINNTALLQQGPSPLNVYLRDRVHRRTTLVSVNLSGTAGGNGDSVPAGLSSDGRYALFESRASDLVPGDTNNATDIFVRDMASHTTVLVSVSTNLGLANGVSRSSVMTPDGRYVAFVSEASNLVENDTNRVPDIFLRDLESHTTSLISVGATPACHGAFFCGSESPDISADGRYVAFYSTATNLVSGVTNQFGIYVRDTIAGMTILASTDARTIMQSVFGVSSNIVSYNQAISANGRYVAFQASMRVPTIASGAILRFSLETGLTDIVNTNAYFPRSDIYYEIHTLSVTPDGRFIAFVANTNDNSGTTTCIYLWDAQTRTTILVSGDLNGHVPIHSTCDWPSVDQTGRFVAFLSSATNLVTNVLDGDYHLYLRDLQTGSTALIDTDTNGIGSSVTPSTRPGLSENGRLVAFESPDGNLVPDDRNHAYDVFVRHARNSRFDLISVRDPALASVTANGQSAIDASALSGDGRWVAFSSDADNLIANDTNALRDVFVRDLLYPTNVLVSVATNGAGGDGPSTEAAISSNGRFVAFTSLADNLVAGDSNGVRDVFVRDLQSGTTALASIGFNGAGPGNHESYSPALSPDGRYVLFRSRATNLGTDSFSGTENLFVRDLHLARTYALTTSGMYPGSAPIFSPDGTLIVYNSTSRLYLWSVQSSSVVYTNIGGFRVAISQDNQRIAYIGPPPSFLSAIDRLSTSNWPISRSYSAPESAGLRFSDDSRLLVYAVSTAPNQSVQVFLYDFQTRATNLISQGMDGLTPGNADSDSPIISPDGRYIIYRSLASNLVAGAENNRSANIFKFDRTLGVTALLTSGFNGSGPSNNRSFPPMLSANGGTLLIPSAASDLVAHDFNMSSDLFASSEALYVWVGLNGPGQGATLAWFSQPKQNYRIEYKAGLADSEWREAAGSMTFIGGRAHFTDAAPSGVQRFYRVVAFGHEKHN